MSHADSVFTIRDLREDDAEKCASIVRANWGDALYYNALLEIAEMFGSSRWRPHYFVAEIDGKIVGYAGFKTAWILWNVKELVWVNVLPEYQGFGVGSALTEHRLKKLREDETALALLMTKRRSFFKKFGFVEAADLDGWALMFLKLGPITIQPSDREALEVKEIIESLRRNH